MISDQIKTPENHLDEVFFKQLLLSEKLRVKILLSLLGTLFILVLIIFIIFSEEYISLFKDRASLQWISLSFGGFILYEFILLNVIKFLIRTNRNFPTIGRFGNTFFEVSIPTILMIVLSYSINPFIVLNGPASFTYFIFIVLSTLRLDFRLSFFTGLVASIEYLGLNFYHAIYSSVESFSSLYFVPLTGSGKAIILFFCGIAAGFVSLQIKKRVMNTLNVIDERNKIINVFGQQVSPEIAEALLLKEEEVGIIKDVCVMFLDIRNFTSMVEKKNPKEIVAYQNEIFGLVIDIINKYKGIINQFLGDGFMATFGAPVTRGNDCSNAVNAAREIIEELKIKNAGRILLPTKVGIGIHYGEAVTGNVGTAARKQYSITGNVVIIASRIEQLNKVYNSQVLVSKEVLENTNSTINNYEPLGAVNIKGRKDPVEIFKLA